MSQWSHPRLAHITTAGILILIVVVSCFAYHVSEGDHNKIHQISIPSIQKSFYNYTIPLTLENGTVIEKTISRNISIHTIINTKSISAQMPLYISSVSEPFNDISEWEFQKLPNEIILIFPDSLKHPIDHLEHQSYNQGFVELYVNPETKRYEGNDNVVYQYASNGGFYIIIPEETKGKFENNFDGTITLSKRTVGDPQELIFEATRFPVEPLSSTVNLQMTNIVQAISVLVVNVGLIQSRKQIIHGVTFCFIHIRDFILPKYRKLIKKIRRK